jgi:membrane associated rhomboid family serine protease
MSLLNSEEKRQLVSTVFFPAYVLLLLWLVKFTEFTFEVSFASYGILPRTLTGLRGIVLSPFIHGDWEHLAGNSIPLLLLGCTLFYFYRPLSYRIYFWVLLLSGVGTWLIGRPSYHIGASGLIYGFSGFIFFSGLIRNNISLLAMSLLVVFLYGGMIWYVFPFKMDISWEGHLAGGISGIVLAVLYRKQGPGPTVYQWQTEEEDEDGEETFPGSAAGDSTSGNITGPGAEAGPVIRYIYRENDKDEPETK